MTIIEFIFDPYIQCIYWVFVVVGVIIALHQETKVKFMAVLVLTSIWPLSIIGILLAEFYNWYTNLKDE